jgi:hypothetical protein
LAAEGGDSSARLQTDAAIPYQASRMRAKRHRISEFEPGIVFGTKVETIKFFCF